MHAVTHHEAAGGAGTAGAPDTADGRRRAALTVAASGPGPAPVRPRRAAKASAGPSLGRWIARQAPSWLMGLVSIGCVLLVWQLATHYRVDFYVRFNNVPSPAEVWATVLELNRSPKFMVNVGMSVQRILIGFAIATALGVGLGLLVGRYRWVRRAAMPALEVLRPIPAIAWVPISIMLWPSNEVSIVFITFLGAFFPILLNTVHGVESVDPVLLRAARSLGAREFTLLREIILPGALPEIFTGLAVGMGVAWVSLIAAEMISGQFGIGYSTWEAYSLIAYPEIVLGMITIGVLGLLCSGAIRLLARMAMPWLRATSNGGH